MLDIGLTAAQQEVAKVSEQLQMSDPQHDCVDLEQLLNPAIDPESVGVLEAVAATSIAVEDDVQGGGGKREQVEVQFKGKGPFFKVVMHLDCDGVLTMRPIQLVAGASSVPLPSKIERHTTIVGCNVSTPKNKRKGHSHLFRVDLLTEDSKQCLKYIVSVKSRASREAWKVSPQTNHCVLCPYC